jgi:hypothetical protein
MALIETVTFTCPVCEEIYNTKAAAEVCAVSHIHPTKTLTCTICGNPDAPDCCCRVPDLVSRIKASRDRIEWLEQCIAESTKAIEKNKERLGLAEKEEQWLTEK